MNLCPYFEVWRKQIPTRRSSPDEVSHHEIKIPYCTHNNSPATLEAARQSLGKAAVLKCDGIIKRCPLPESVRPAAQTGSRASKPGGDGAGPGKAFTLRAAGKPE
jgi:hypothetical protein